MIHESGVDIERVQGGEAGTIWTLFLASRYWIESTPMQKGVDEKDGR